MFLVVHQTNLHFVRHKLVGSSSRSRFVEAFSKDCSFRCISTLHFKIFAFSNFCKFFIHIFFLSCVSVRRGLRFYDLWTILENQFDEVWTVSFLNAIPHSNLLECFLNSCNWNISIPFNIFFQGKCHQVK